MNTVDINVNEVLVSLLFVLTCTTLISTFFCYVNSIIFVSFKKIGYFVLFCALCKAAIILSGDHFYVRQHVAMITTFWLWALGGGLLAGHYMAKFIQTKRKNHE